MARGFRNSLSCIPRGGLRPVVFIQSFYHHLLDCHRDFTAGCGRRAVAAPACGGLLAHVAGRRFWSGTAGLFLARPSYFSARPVADKSDNTVIPSCASFSDLSVGGISVARWLFSARRTWAGPAESLRCRNGIFRGAVGKCRFSGKRKPIFALVKKEFQLPASQLDGAAGCWCCTSGHCAVEVSYFSKIRRRNFRLPHRNFWMLWLVIPVVIGSKAVAEERRLGVMEGQLCLRFHPDPVRHQGFLTLFSHFSRWHNAMLLETWPLDWAQEI